MNYSALAAANRGVVEYDRSGISPHAPNLEHQKAQKVVLKAVSRANNSPYQTVFAYFIAGPPPARSVSG